MRRTRISKLSVAAVLCALSPVAASAQVIISTGVQSYYDDNIYTEDEFELPTPDPEQPAPLFDESNDGKTNDDIVTNVYIGASGKYDPSASLTTGYNFRVGGLVFADQADQSRFILDSNLRIASTEISIPKPFTLYASSSFSSGNTGVTAAQGTASRQSQVHTAALGAQMDPVMIAEATGVSASYALVRTDFLGEWLFGSSDDTESNEVNGADSISNNASLTFSQFFSERLTGFFANNVSYVKFTDTESALVSDKSQLDRINYTPALGVNYLLTERLSATLQAGVDFIRLTDEPETRTVSFFNADGSQSTVTIDPEQETQSLMYSGSLAYLLTEFTTVSVFASQAASTDIDGTRVFVRSLGGNLSQILAEKMTLSLGGSYSQYTRGDDYSNLTKRFEGTAALRYSLSDSLSFATGYNFTDQSADSSGVNVLGNDRDFQSNRVFISLDTGFVGLPG